MVLLPKNRKAATPPFPVNGTRYTLVSSHIVPDSNKICLYGCGGSQKKIQDYYYYYCDIYFEDPYKGKNRQMSYRSRSEPKLHMSSYEESSISLPFFQGEKFWYVYCIYVVGGWGPKNKIHDFHIKYQTTTKSQLHYSTLILPYNHRIKEN